MSYDFHTRNHKDLNKPIPEFRSNDLRHVTITKTGTDISNGVIVERKSDTKEYYIKQVIPGGLLQQLHGDRIQAGDRLVKINNKDVQKDFMSLWDMNNYLKKELTITLHVERSGLHLKPKNEWGPAEYSANTKIQQY
jgi:C-terminal processing protease CtpA/Prc